MYYRAHRDDKIIDLPFEKRDNRAGGTNNITETYCHKTGGMVNNLIPVNFLPGLAEIPPEHKIIFSYTLYG